jgi:hypothetical protein
MIKQLPPGTTYAIHLENPVSASGGKSWIGCLVTGKPGIVVVYGPTVKVGAGGGTVNMTNNPPNAPNVRTIANKKISEGYQEIDRYDSVTGWESQRQAAPVPKPATPAPKPAPPKKPAVKPLVSAKNILSETDRGGDDGAPSSWFW